MRCHRTVREVLNEELLERSLGKLEDCSRGVDALENFQSTVVPQIYWRTLRAVMEYCRYTGDKHCNTTGAMLDYWRSVREKLECIRNIEKVLKPAFVLRNVAEILEICLNYASDSKVSKHSNYAAI